jgi:hypothetical protein
MEWRKSVLACLEWPGMEDVSFGLTGIVGIEEVGLDLNGMAWKRESQS